MKLIIRDDDLSYWTSIDGLKSVYEFIWNKKVKISFAVIPFAVKQYNLGNRNIMYQDDSPAYGIGNNQNITAYLKQKISENLIEIMLHGYNHLYCFRVNNSNEFYVANKSNLDKYRDGKNKIHFIGEYAYQDYETLYKKTKKGKEYLEDIFEVKIKNFVPPSNDISRRGIKAVWKNGLNISGLIGKRYNREITLKGLNSYFKRIFFKFKENKTYPHILDYGYHKELAGYAFTPSANIKKLYEQFEYCRKYHLPFQIATHHWQLKASLLSEFYRLIDYILIQGYESKLLNQVII